MAQRALIAGNWKMFGLAANLAELDALKASLGASAEALDIVVCPPATLIAQAAWRLKGAPIRLGGQDCHAAKEGAHTGDVSAAMLGDAGAAYVILGHSERRRDHGETSADVRAKTGAALQAGLTPIVCIGETIEQRKAGEAEDVTAMQLRDSIPDEAPDGIVIAYEPVWAIGTGLTPTKEEIGAIHARIHAELAARFGERAASMRVLYGGSVKPSNAAEIFAIAGVNGALVGGASLKAADFLAIIRAHPDTGGAGN